MTQQLPPEAIMFQFLGGEPVTQAIGAVARLGIADLLRDGARTCDDLATATGTHAPSLYRLLRATASLGVFTETAPKTFGLTPLAEVLRSDAPGALRPLAIMMSDTWHRDVWTAIMDSIRTGEPATKTVLGADIFEYLHKDPEAAATFHAGMATLTRRRSAAVLAAYELSGVTTLVDVGGGHGMFVASALKANPGMRGVVFDLPEVVVGANDELKRAGVLDRCQVVGGNFFESVPAGGDAYLASRILHDWSDDDSVRILDQVRRVIPPTGRLIIVESVIAPGDAPQPAKLLDLEMLTVFGGRERTADEFAALFARSGFQFSRVVPTRSQVSVVEAKPI